jgi:hypothetical protein
MTLGLFRLKDGFVFFNAGQIAVFMGLKDLFQVSGKQVAKARFVVRIQPAPPVRIQECATPVALSGSIANQAFLVDFPL